MMSNYIIHDTTWIEALKTAARAEHDTPYKIIVGVNRHGLLTIDIIAPRDNEGYLLSVHNYNANLYGVTEAMCAIVASWSVLRDRYYSYFNDFLLETENSELFILYDLATLIERRDEAAQILREIDRRGLYHKTEDALVL